MTRRPMPSASALSRRTALGRVAAVGAALGLGGRLGRAAAQDATPAACPATTPGQNKALVERYWAAVWTAGGEAAIPAVLAPDEVHHWGLGADTVGREQFRERLRRFLDAFPDFAVEVEHLVAEGDQAISHQVYRATHRGEWLGVAPTGRQVSWAGMNVFRIECGRIAESWGVADHLGLLEQLGGLPGIATPVAGTPTA